MPAFSNDLLASMNYVTSLKAQLLRAPETIKPDGVPSQITAVVDMETGEISVDYAYAPKASTAV